jgi:hypothetical protein
MTKRAIWMLVSLALLHGGAAKARADFAGELWLNTGASANATLAQVGSLGTPDATFSVPQFNFDSNVGGYTVGGFLNHPTFSNTSAAFAAAGGANANLNNTYFYFTGSAFLNAGSNTFVVGHDDGLQLNFDGIGLVVNQPGPTSFTNTPFNVNAPSAGFYNFELSYGETAGPPAELLWTINGAPPSTVPAPSSLALCGTALFSVLTYLGLRRRKLVLA